MPRPGVRRGSVRGQPIACERPALLSSVVDLVGRGGAGRLNRFTSAAPARGQLSGPLKAGVQGAGRATLGSAAAAARMTGRHISILQALYRKPARENGFPSEGEITPFDDVLK